VYGFERASTRKCPICGIAMVGQKIDQGSAGCDTFACPLCSTIVRYRPREPDRDSGQLESR
jgi:hypothetical protein